MATELPLLLAVRFAPEMVILNGVLMSAVSTNRLTSGRYVRRRTPWRSRYQARSRGPLVLLHGSSNVNMQKFAKCKLLILRDYWWALQESNLRPAD